jgi:hypothetical protein
VTSLKSGGILGFVSFEPIANVINAATLGIPGYSIHHVGMVGRQHGQPLCYESTTWDRPPCVRSQALTQGVQAHTLEELVAIPAHRQIWHYPLRSELYDHEEDRLLYYLDSQIGCPYDLDGAIHAGGVAFSFLSKMLRGEDLAAMFCSELCVAALVKINRLNTASASHWSPNKLCRYLVRTGICDKPKRIK